MKTAAPVLRFRPFEVDVRAGELRKHGMRVRLPVQSLKILLMLLEQPGEVVLRTDIRLRLWPNDTVVDFDQSISAAMSRLRAALGESAGEPRFIETLSKRGYRFLGEVTEVSGPAPNYQVLEKLGQGGMGVVYRAEDLKLGRQVALKFLPLADGELPDSALRRFDREARTASALNHPNICTIHGLEKVDGRPAIVMELLEGETLAVRLARGKLETPEALDIAGQIAAALTEAHGAGVVHRDLKPANIMLTKNGPKVLDFGLATMEGTTPKTPIDEGAVPGTLYYMSPEQMQGEDVDARSDIFNLGLVLYEMLSGQRPFAGDSAANLKTAILKRQPAPLAGVPPAVKQFVWRCLAKTAQTRWQTAAIAKEELERIAEARVEPATNKPVARRRRWPWLVAAAAAVLAIGTAVYRMPEARPELGPTHTLPLTTFPGNQAFVTFSPDGERIAFSWVGSSPRDFNIFVKPVGNGDPVQLTRGVDDRLPQWSPDGSQIAFQRSTPAGHDLMVVPVGGGAERKIAEMGIGLAWSPDGKEIAYVTPYAPNGSGGLVVRSLKSGKLRQLTDPKPYAEGLVAWSPDGKQIAFTRTLSETARELFVVPAQGGEARRLTFDMQITEGFAWTSDSRSLVLASYRLGGPGLWRIPLRGGAPESIASAAHHPKYPAISPRGNRLAFSEAFVDSNIWEYQRALPAKGAAPPAFQSPRCLICSTVEDDSPRFSPDGRKIVFVSHRSGSPELWLADSDGDYPIQLTTFRGAAPGSPRWSPDGHWIAFDTSAAGSPDIFVISSQGGTPRPLTSEASSEILPSWSHDGRWIYFVSDRGHEPRIWKVPFEGGPARQVTQHNGGEPLESPDGKRLYYFRGVQGIASVPSEGGPEEIIPELSGLLRTRAWAVQNDGIYFYQDMGASARRVQHFSFATRKVTTLLNPAAPTLGIASGLDVSPDGRRLLYTQADHRVDGLMMIENFR